jgi:hypothetical protein
MARDELRQSLWGILLRDGVDPKNIPGLTSHTLDDIIEEVLRATAADVARKAMEWWRSRKGEGES